ncbi:MAG: lytic transglycosylase domain-containing protein [Prevotella sp.]|nr:lytic transglycosylase domain-containing protein [Prevotella sp.]
MNIKRQILTLTIAAIASGTVLAQSEEYVVVTDEQGNREEIGVPASFTFDVDKRLEMYHAKTLLREECNLPNYDPETSTETIIDRLQRMPTMMEMTYNEPVRKFIDRYTKRGRRQVSALLGIANFYMPIFEQALESYGLPLELKYLPIIESGLNPNATSHAGAGGLWQFMPSAAKQYDLRINSLVDERRDPIKGSYAAAHMLSDLYKIFGDWNLVIAAYNCGPGNVNKAIHRAGGETDYWKIYPHLPRETRGYVPAFIAANYIMNYYCEHNICPMDTRLPLHTDTIHVDRDLHFNQIAAVIGIDVNQLKELNPQYRRNIVNGSSGTASIRMPLPYIMKFIDLQDSIYNYQRSSYHKKRPQVAINEAPSGHAHRPRRSEPDQKSEVPSVNQQDTYGSKGKTRHKKEYQNTPKNNRRRSHGK